jgi:hypothetical protein
LKLLIVQKPSTTATTLKTTCSTTKLGNVRASSVVGCRTNLRCCCDKSSETSRRLLPPLLSALHGGELRLFVDVCRKDGRATNRMMFGLLRWDVAVADAPPFHWPISGKLRQGAASVTMDATPFKFSLRIDLL